MMLLGRNSNESPPLDYKEDERFSSRLSYVSTVETTWWNKWVKDVMPTLLPYPKWRKEQRNLAEGDLVLMWYTGNMKDHYRMARVVEVFPDQKGLVRTVRVKYRRKNTKEDRSVCSSRNLIVEKVAVQRLQLLEAAGFSDADTFIKGRDLNEKKIADKVDQVQTDLDEHEEDQSEEQVEPLVVKVQVNDKNTEEIIDLKNMK